MSDYDYIYGDWQIRQRECHDCKETFSYHGAVNADEYWRIGIMLCPACLQVRRWIANEKTPKEPKS